MKIGVITDCFKPENVKAGIEAAAAIEGVSGVQIYASRGEFAPSALSSSDRKKYKELLASCGLELSALCGDPGGYGFESAEGNPARIELTERIVDLAVDLGTRVITTHIGVIPADKSVPRYAIMQDAVGECGRYAAARGVTLAIETGPEKAPVLKEFVDGTSGGVGVNLDPANFVMVTGQDPVEAVRLLGNRIVHTHAKDGKRLRVADPADIYHAFAVGGIEALNVADYFTETPLGTGDVDFDAYLAELKKTGFDGFLTIEREAGSDPAADIRTAVAFLKSRLSRL